MIVAPQQEENSNQELDGLVKCASKEVKELTLICLSLQNRCVINGNLLEISIVQELITLLLPLILINESRSILIASKMRKPSKEQPPKPRFLT